MKLLVMIIMKKRKVQIKILKEIIYMKIYNQKFETEKNIYL